MGLFSFLKNAGAKLLSRKDEDKVREEAAAKNAEVEEMLRNQKLGMLSSIVQSLGISVENLSMEYYDEDTITVYGVVESQADKEKVILAIGNVDGIGGVDDRMSVVTPEPEADFYEVKKGDTLSKIAKAHYGDWKKYHDIFDANKPMLSDPDKIYPGQTLRLPKV